jgi:hypothetical protein
MERNVIAIALLSLALVGSVNAQVDSPKKQQKNNEIESKTIATDPSAAAIAEPTKEDRVAVQIDEIPDLLRLTLEQDKKYRGWHFAEIYLDRSMKEYLFHITDSNKITRTFKFDENGKEIPEAVPSAKATKSRKKNSKG